jgi:hypothetical protein
MIGAMRILRRLEGCLRGFDRIRLVVSKNYSFNIKRSFQFGGNLIRAKSSSSA